jgi:hypothetical protein
MKDPVVKEVYREWETMSMFADALRIIAMRRF